MISSNPSKTISDSACPTCSGVMTVRQAHPFPLLLQVIFGVSFIAFLLLIDRVRLQPILLWGWSAVQIVLGGLLVRARARANKRILICIRCERPVR